MLFRSVFIRSGIRFDYLVKDEDERFFKALVSDHVSGQLKVAPEHCCNEVLGHMSKPAFEAYRKFNKRFYEITKSINKKQYLVPYLMSSHPGCTLKHALAMALFLKEEGINPEQVQDFYPTPGTISTAMYYSGLDPYTLKPVYVPVGEEKAMQRALLQYNNPKNRALVIKALTLLNRRDLIGYGKNQLVRPIGKGAKEQQTKKGKNIISKHK